MNGVRRLLGGPSSSAPSLPPSDPALTPSSSAAPPFSSKNSWSASNGDNHSASGSPKTTPGLFLKKDKPRPLMSDDHGSYNRSSESGRPSTHAYQSSISSVHSSLNRNGSLQSSTSSPRLVPLNGDRNLSRRTTEESTDSAWIVKRDSTISTTRDELLMSLMASEAVVDSRDYDVLNAEEVEELKKEHALVSSRVEALQKKVALETKIRDAAVSLSRVNSAQKRVSKQTDEHLESANKRVDTAQKELWRLADRANEIGRRLLEHRAAVLSISVRNMEKKMSASSEDSGYDSSNRSTLMSPPSATSTFSSPSRQTKFDGPHLFAGHENAIVPRRKLSPEAALKEITALEDRLKAATATLAESSKIQAEMKKELSQSRLEKQEVEMTMGLELQTAEDKIASLEKELPRLDELDTELRALQQERMEWEDEKRRLEDSAKEAAVLRSQVEDLQNGVAERSGDSAKMLNELREAHQRELLSRDEQIRNLKDEFADERAGWERERNTLEDEKMDDLARLQQEMDQLRAQDEDVLQQANDELNLTLNSLRKLTQQFNVPLAQRDSRTSAMQHLLGALTQHLGDTQSKMEQLAQGGAERDRSRQLEVELQRMGEKLQATSAELEETKKERDAAKRETIASSARSITSSPRSKTDSIRTPPAAYTNLATITPESSEFGPDTEGAKFIAALQPVWAILPSPEARAAKFSANQSRSYRPQGSPSLSSASLPSPGANPSGSAANQAPTSLSELDVRSLKTLYDPRQQAQPASPLNGQFTMEGFIARVNALVTDDRALIERLLRFAQAHDLLKKNAERAQKLAQDGNIALETYQKQVKLLETNNSSLRLKVTELQDELRLLHDITERLTAEKHQLEAFAAEQAETCRQLSEANDTLSARALNLAEEAANAPEMVRKQLDDVKRQLDDNKKLLDDRTKELEDSRDEVDAMRSAEQGQRIALLDELNTMQTENAQLRQQLRAAKAGR